MEGKGGRRLLGHWRTRAVAGVLFGSAAPRIMAHHCRAKVDGAAGPAPSAVSDSGHRHVSPLPRHHAWRGTGSAKSVSLKKNDSVRFKISFKKVLK